jgi:hypothetical protein
LTVGASNAPGVFEEYAPIIREAGKSGLGS